MKLASWEPQAIAITKQRFDAIGGFINEPIMEDFQLVTSAEPLTEPLKEACGPRFLTAHFYAQVQKLRVSGAAGGGRIKIIPARVPSLPWQTVPGVSRLFLWSPH